MSAGATLREKMARGMVMAPFVYDGLGARVAEQAGFEAVYLTGFGNAASLGIPDVGLVTQTEMVEKIRILANACAVPVIADADTGYGNYSNVHRTVRAYEKAGAAALHLEDQVWPKRCGYMANKQVIGKDEAVSKIKAALDARLDPAFVVIARTDTLAVNGWDDVEARANAFAEAGADLVFVDGIKTIEDVREYARRLARLPKVINNVPLLPTAEVKRAGAFELCLHPGVICSSWRALLDATRQLADTGDVESVDPQEIFFRRIVGALGAQEYFDMENRYKV